LLTQHGLITNEDFAPGSRAAIVVVPYQRPFEWLSVTPTTILLLVTLLEQCQSPDTSSEVVHLRNSPWTLGSDVLMNRSLLIPTIKDLSDGLPESRPSLTVLRYLCRTSWLYTFSSSSRGGLVWLSSSCQQHPPLNMLLI
jgi:hypothetical protein